MSESHETRLRRLKMRSIRRGIREMDLILGAFADGPMATLSAADLDLYDALLAENDQDLYAWVSGQSAPPARFADLIGTIARHQQRTARVNPAIPGT